MMNVMGHAGFRITAIGTVDARYDESSAGRLSPASRHLLAILVCAGPSGISADDLAWERSPTTPPSAQSIRMAAARLRRHLGEDILPRADDGVYRLCAPIDDVDAWTLSDLAGRPEAAVDLRELRQVLVQAPALSDLPGSLLFERAERRIRADQGELLIRLAESVPEAVTGDVLQAMVDRVETNPLDERLVFHAAAALGRAGDRAAALRLIRRSRSALGDAGLEPEQRVVDLEQRLLHAPGRDTDDSDRSNGDDRSSVGLTDGPPAGIVSPPINPMRAQLTGTYVGARHELDRILQLVDGATQGMTTIVLSGPSGVGKTRINAEVAEYMVGKGLPVVSIVPSPFSDRTPFAPLVASLPSLGQSVAEVLAGDRDADSARLELWRQAQAALDGHRVDGTLAVLVDDAQWLDEATAEFVAHLVSSAAPEPTVLLLNGRDDVAQSPRWAQLRDRVETLGVNSVEVEPLPFESVRELVDDLRPRMPGSLLTALSREIHEQAGGLPGVARLLLASVPHGSAVLADGVRATRSAPLAPALSGLSPDARRVGVAAAVIGSRFGFADLRAVSTLDDPTIFAGLDELVDHGLVTDVDLTEYELVHALARQGLDSLASRRERAEHHRRAADHYATDIHRRAHHLARAIHVATRDDAVGALRDSALLAMTEHAYRLAIRRFESVEEMDPAALTPVERGQFARALDLSGMHEAALLHRQQAFDEAAHAGDWSAALAAATSGLPEVEPLDGDAAVAQQLTRIDTGTLSDDESWYHACTAARQLTIVGDMDRALACAERAVRFASTPEQRVGAALARRMCISTHGTPAEGLAVMRAVESDVDVVSDALRADYFFNMAIEHQRNGDTGRAESSLDHLDELTGRTAVKSWHAMMMRATLAFDVGRLQRARELRATAHSFAVESGLGEADNALLASTFTDLWLSGQAEFLIDEIDGGVLDPSHRHLTKAAAAAVLFEAGQLDRAADLAAETADVAMTATSPQTTVALAITSAALARSGDPEVVDWVRARFDAAGNSMLILGASAANLGPIMRYRANLAATADERRAFLHDALRLAEQSDSLLWQAIVLRDLIVAGDHGRSEELAALLADTELETFVPIPGT